MKHQIHPLGDQGLCITWGDNKPDERLNARVLAFHTHLLRENLPGILDIVPAYCSLSIVYDAPKLLRLFPTQAPFEYMREKVEQQLQNWTASGDIQGRALKIPVCYDLSLAPDLASLATRNGLDVAEIIHLHTSREYRVYMLGFLPGFPYMGEVDARIAAPRLASPRLSVPAGSVGIAGQQTGIYPLDSPGGWNIIGCTPLRMFDPENPDPVLLRPGDRVRFVEISKVEFEAKSTTK